MKALFIANSCYEKNEGIYKKIFAEASAIANYLGECSVIMQNKEGSVRTDTSDMSESTYPESVLEVAKKIILTESIGVIYIRLMVPNFALINLLKTAQSHSVKVYYEIPTYPYYAEQLRTSRKKYRAVAKVVSDVLFFPSIRRHCDHIVTIRSNSKLPLKKKMYEITNGVETENLKSKTYSGQHDGIFRMVTVGTLYPYHGYDRIIKGMKNCNEEINGVPVEFHVIGESKTIDDLKKMTLQYGLKNVYFHGKKTTQELNALFEDFDVGLGCLALHRRNADTDTTLKIVEYYCRGIPVVTSGKVPYPDKSVTITVPDNELDIEIGEIYNQWKNISGESKRALSEKAKAIFDWDVIMTKLFSSTLTDIQL